MAEPDVGIKNKRKHAFPRIPEDLLQFIRRDTYSLLVKGFAGTGKTTLALTILNVLGIKNNFFYISTRISPRQLYQYYPWLKDLIGQSRPRGTGLAREHELMSSFEDARLDEPESLFERITNQLMDIKSPIIIIDSWEAIASFMDREARLNNERVLQTWRERAGAKLIFVNEDPADTSLDNLVDGVVRLDKVEKGYARIREISLLKLRGVRITKPSYLFTLDKCSFRSFQTYSPQHFGIELDSISSPHLKNNIKNLPITMLEHGLIKSGYDELDLNLGGGIPRRALVILEVDSNISTEVAIAFLFRVIQAFLSSGNVVFFEPPEEVGSVTAN